MVLHTAHDTPTYTSKFRCFVRLSCTTILVVLYIYSFLFPLNFLSSLQLQTYLPPSFTLILLPHFIKAHILSFLLQVFLSSYYTHKHTTSYIPTSNYLLPFHSLLSALLNMRCIFITHTHFPTFQHL